MDIQINNQFFKLYSCCIPVKGAKRSIICDLQRNDFIFIPNEFAEVFLKKGRVTIKQLLLEYIEYQNFEYEFERCLSLLLDKEYGFYSENSELFPDINEEILYPEIISNAILDIDQSISFDICKFIKELSLNLCHFVVIRFFSHTSLCELEKIVRLFHNSTIRSLEICIPFSFELDNEKGIFDFMAEFPICKSFLIHSSTKNVQHSNNYHEIIYTEFNMTINNCCGFISPYYFRINNHTFFEAKKYNSCLYKKISIDVNGLVKNCPTMRQHFGHFDQIESLSKIMQSDDFTCLGKIRKDEIEICKDCEFRYICHDCRAIIQDENNIKSKPKNCSYDPYETSWV